MHQTALIHKLRIELDGLHKRTEQIPYFNVTREGSLVKTHLQEGRMMLGKLLSSMGEASPYSDDKLSPATDTASVGPEVPADPTSSEHVKTLRAILQDQLNSLMALSSQLPHMEYLHQSFKLNAELTGAYQSLSHAKHWAGMLLVKVETDGLPQTATPTPPPPPAPTPPQAPAENTATTATAPVKNKPAAPAAGSNKPA